MIRSLLIACAALSLAACGATGPVASTGPAPAQPTASAITPLANTTIDDKAIVLAYEALEVAASAVDELLVAQVIKPGSPAALRIADGLSSAKTWLSVAGQAQKAAQADNAAVALLQASSALAGVYSAIGNR